MSIIHRLTLTVLFTFLAALPGQPVQSTVPLAPEQFSCTSVTEIPQSECEALVDLYEGADGPNWINNDGWLATTTPCSWHGVTCSGGSVSQLHFFSNGLSSLPPQIGNLTNLTELFLVSNQLGILPPEIGNLTNLTELSLSYNRLSSLPSEIGNLTNLMGLFLISNQLSSLPPEIGNLTNLTELSLSDNRLSSLPPEIGNLTNLMRLSLGDDLRLGFGRNQLSSLPPEIGNFFLFPTS